MPLIDGIGGGASGNRPLEIGNIVAKKKKKRGSVWFCYNSVTAYYQAFKSAIGHHGILIIDSRICLYK